MDAPPPNPAPIIVIGAGVDDVHALIVFPGATVGAGRTVIVLVSTRGRHGRFDPVPSGSTDVRVRVTVPV